METEFKGSKGELSYERDGNSGFVVESTKVDEIATFWIDKEIDDSEAEYNAKLFTASKDLLNNFISAIILLKQTTEFEVLESYRIKVLEFEKVLEKALT